MEAVWVWIVRTLGAVGAFVAGLLGGWDVTLQVLLLAMTLDFVTGLLVAFHGRSVKTQGGGFASKESFLGLTRKIFVLLLVCLATALDGALGTPGVLRLAVSMFYVANEGLSILENSALLGMPLPAALKTALEAMKEKADTPSDGADM